MPGNNKALAAAARAKKDEFYTQREDIEQEVMHYWSHFKGKTVLLNCDDPFESNFFFYFASYFNTLELKKLIAVSYEGSPIAYTDPFYDSVYGGSFLRHAYKAEMTCLRDTDGDTGINKKDIKELFEMGENTLTRLKGDGDFRSQECIELLKEADIVVTNPPFSLFREYVAQLVQYDKKFLILGNKNAITYKEIFPLLKENKIWFGYTQANFFMTPSDGLSKNQTGLTRWFTNLEIRKHHENLDLVERYYGQLGTPEKYPHYDNYDAIEVSKVVDIPKDYEGVMGVPITFMDKYNPDQFEIIWTTDRGGDGMLEEYKKSWDRYDAPVVNGKGIYKRILIRNRHPAPKEYMD